MVEALFWLFHNPAGWVVLALLIVPGFVFMVRSANRNLKRDLSADQMAHRDLVARTIERADYLAMSDSDFKAWFDANEGSIFPHEREAMERHRKAKGQEKQKVDQKKDRLHPYQN